MENTILLPTALLEEKSTYVKINREKVEKLEKMIALLNKRKEILNSEESKAPNISLFERNENEILLLRTDYELAKHHKNSQAITKEIDGYIEKAGEILTEMNEKWNEIIAKAKKEGVHKKDIAQIVKSMDDVDLEANIDVKINYYLQLKSMVLNQPSPLKKV
jgi:type III secretion system FlhB-like substrate exporter